jgi:hypothetical protein
MDNAISLLEIEASELYTVLLEYLLSITNIPATISSDLSSRIYDQVNTLISNYDDIIRRVALVGPGIRIPVLDPLSYDTLQQIVQMCQARFGIQMGQPIPTNNNGIHTPPRLRGGPPRFRGGRRKTRGVNRK